MHIRQITHIKSMKPQYNKSLIYTRLGYNKTKTLLDKQMTAMVERGIEAAEEICNVQGGFRVCDIEEITLSRVAVKDNIFFESQDLASFLNGANQVVFMFSSAGNEIVQTIQREMSTGNAAYGIVMDAAASIIADAGLSWIMDYINMKVKREGKTLTNNRYSPGYGDFTLQNQKSIFAALNMSEYQIELTEKYMLLPEKTVTAIAGII